MRTLLLCAAFLLTPLPLAAQVYTYIDAEGNRVFTDQPRSQSAQRVELAPANQMPAFAPPPSPTPSPITEQPALRYQVLRILVPQPDATIRDNAGNLIVTVSSEPALMPGHNYRLLLNGNEIGNVGRSPVFPLQHLDRGTHQLAVEIVDSEGRIVERTPSQPFHLHRISLAQKRRMNPCKTEDYGVRPECPIAEKPVEKKSLIPFM